MNCFSIVVLCILLGLLATYADELLARALPPVGPR